MVQFVFTHYNIMYTFPKSCSCLIMNTRNLLFIQLAWFKKRIRIWTRTKSFRMYNTYLFATLVFPTGHSIFFPVKTYLFKEAKEAGDAGKPGTTARNKKARSLPETEKKSPTKPVSKEEALARRAERRAQHAAFAWRDLDSVHLQPPQPKRAAQVRVRY
jgi:hypothetical protein